MRPIWHKPMRPIWLKMEPHHETDLAQQVPFSLLVLSISLLIRIKITGGTNRRPVWPMSGSSFPF